MSVCPNAFCNYCLIRHVLWVRHILKACRPELSGGLSEVRMSSQDLPGLMPILSGMLARSWLNLHMKLQVCAEFAPAEVSGMGCGAMHRASHINLMPSTHPLHAAEMPWLFPKLKFRLFKIEAGECGASGPSYTTPSDFMALVPVDQAAAAHLLDTLAASGGAAGHDEPASASFQALDLYGECIAALSDGPLTVGALEVMHSQVSCRRLSLSSAAGFVNHAILCLEEEQEASGQWQGVVLGLGGCIPEGFPGDSWVNPSRSVLCLPRSLGSQPCGVAVPFFSPLENPPSTQSTSSQHPRLARLFSALLRPLILHHPGLLLSCPALEAFCLRNLQHSEGIALFQFLKQQQELYL